MSQSRLVAHVKGRLVDQLSDKRIGPLGRRGIVLYPTAVKAALPLASVHANPRDCPFSKPRFQRRSVAANPEERLDGRVVAVRDHQLEHLVNRKGALRGPSLGDGTDA